MGDLEGPYKLTREGAGLKPKIIGILALLVLFLVVLVQNTHVVTLRLLFWDLVMSQVILIGLSVLVGFVLGYIICLLTGKDKSSKYGKY